MCTKCIQGQVLIDILDQRVNHYSTDILGRQSIDTGSSVGPYSAECQPTHISQSQISKLLSNCGMRC